MLEAVERACPYDEAMDGAVERLRPYVYSIDAAVNCRSRYQLRIATADGPPLALQD